MYGEIFQMVFETLVHSYVNKTDAWLFKNCNKVGKYLNDKVYKWKNMSVLVAKKKTDDSSKYTLSLC